MTLYRALHLAAKDGMVPVTQMLLTKGASVFAVDEKGHYPALSCAGNERIAECLELIISQMMIAGDTPRTSLSRGSLSGLVNSTIGEWVPLLYRGWSISYCSKIVVFLG